MRSKVVPMALSSSGRAVVHEIDPHQAIAKLRSMEAVVSSSIATGWGMAPGAARAMPVSMASNSVIRVARRIRNLKTRMEFI